MLGRQLENLSSLLFRFMLKVFFFKFHTFNFEKEKSRIYASNDLLLFIFLYFPLIRHWDIVWSFLLACRATCSLLYRILYYSSRLRFGIPMTIFLFRFFFILMHSSDPLLSRLSFSVKVFFHSIFVDSSHLMPFLLLCA